MVNTPEFGFFILIAVWSLCWMGIASWKAARNGQKVWFIVFLLVHTLGILEILYLGFFQKNKNLVSKNKKVLKRKN